VPSAYDHIKRHYSMTHSRINPSRIVPDGPVLDWEVPPHIGATRT
jgi:glutathionyl-hydroquinone reductase